MDETPKDGKTPGMQQAALPPALHQDEVLPVETDDLTWENAVERSKKPVAAMFYSPTCVFCHQIEPYFRSYAGEYHDSVVFVRLNILASPWTAERYGVKSTPTFKFFCNGKPVQEIAGAVYPAILKKVIDEVLIRSRECSQDPVTIDYNVTGYG
jgi:thioredoxin-like negative regulator of GroEL